MILGKHDVAAEIPFLCLSVMTACAENTMACRGNARRVAAEFSLELLQERIDDLFQLDAAARP